MKDNEEHEFIADIVCKILESDRGYGFKVGSKSNNIIRFNTVCGYIEYLYSFDLNDMKIYGIDRNHLQELLDIEFRNQKLNLL